MSLIEENIISHFFVSVKKYNKIPVLSPWLAQFCEGLWVGAAGLISDKEQHFFGMSW